MVLARVQVVHRTIAKDSAISTGLQLSAVQMGQGISRDAAAACH